MDTDGNGILVRAAGAALAAAVVGGVVWGLIVKTTDYEVGFVAWGIGFLVGTAAVMAAGGRKGVPLQAIAIVASLIGILIGKYLSFAWVLQEVAAEGGAAVGVFSGETVEFFFDELGIVFGWFDLLWVGLAVVTAFRIAQPDAEAPAVATE